MINKSKTPIELDSLYIYSPDGDALLVELYGADGSFTIDFGDYKVCMDYESAHELAEKILYTTMEDD
tara:strand:+ start:2618 stop:2818 length:201 start_codon:yes stop_codon:yes gene_type:complete